MVPNPSDRDRAEVNRAIVFAPDETVTRWIAQEVSGQRLHVQRAPSVKLLVAELIDSHPPRPQIAIVDFDALTPADVLHLHSIREQGWFGTLIALGSVSQDLRTSLNIGCVLPRPLGSEVLRKAITDVGLHRPTTRIRKLER